MCILCLFSQSAERCLVSVRLCRFSPSSAPRLCCRGRKAASGPQSRLYLDVSTNGLQHKRCLWLSFGCLRSGGCWRTRCAPLTLFKCLQSWALTRKGNKSAVALVVHGLIWTQGDHMVNFRRFYTHMHRRTHTSCSCNVWGLLHISFTPMCESCGLQFVHIFSKGVRAMNCFLPAPVNPFSVGINQRVWTAIHRQKCTAGLDSEYTLWLGANLHTRVELLSATEHLSSDCA